MQTIALSQPARPSTPLDLGKRAGKYLVFSLGAEEFGAEVLKVREIMGMQDITAIPQVPMHVKGVINLRGKVIPVIDLRLKFGMTPQEYTLRTCIVVVRTRKGDEETFVGMIVDCVVEVLSLTASDIEDAPDFGPGIVAPYLTGMAKIKGKVKILKQADLTKLSKQIDITVTGEGLKIELIEDQGGTFFESGSPKLSPSGVELLNLLSAQLKVLPNRLLIEGHTDAQPYSSDTGYTNWELSSDRANSARRLLQQGGVGPNQISQVRGYADQMLRVPSNPLDPSNRRVSLIVQWADAAPLPRDAPLPQSSGGPSAAANGIAPESADKSGNPPLRTQPGTLPPSTSGITRIQPPPVPATAEKRVWMARIRALIPVRKK